MTLPKFSVRELLLLTTIIALALPYVYRSAFAARRINLSSSEIEALVASFEPKARVRGRGGSSNSNGGATEFSIVVPESAADSFALKLKDAMEKQLRSSGWSQRGSGSGSTNGKTTGFHLNFSNGASEYAVRCRILERRR